MFHRFAMMVASATLFASSVVSAQVPMDSSQSQRSTIKADDVATPLIAPGEPLTVTDTRLPGVTPVLKMFQSVVALAKKSISTPTAVVAPNATMRELECLAVGVYFESKSEPHAGQMAVAHVIANRAKSRRFPSSYCGVLFQRGQFSFIRSGGWPSIAKAGAQWKSAMNVARLVDSAAHPSNIGKALFFHAKRVSPRWKLTRVGSIGNHVFYR